MGKFPISYAEEIWTETQKRVDSHLSTRDEHWNPVKSLADLSRQVAQEYEGRFLIELVQNAYDAHPKGSRGGHVSIHLDNDEGDHGVLYIANRGLPFQRANFDALSNIANSSKPPGEGIGNKGLGFRSVLQVCDNPEVYSRDPTDDSDIAFSGYSFTFARDEDLRRLVESDADYTILCEEFSRYLLPVPVTPPPTVVDRFSEIAVTVIRLQLRSESARATALEQLRRLTDPSAPVMLFLSRLETITVSMAPDAELPAVTIARTEVDLAPESRIDDTELSVVETAGRRFLVATRRLEEEAVRGAITESIEDEKLDPSWREWDGEAEVAVAVGIDAGSLEPLVYTFLPMQEPAPFYGYVHAPFHTRMARTDLSDTVPLNAMFLDAAAWTALAVARELASGGTSALDREQRDSAVIDLLAWKGDHVMRIQAASEQLEAVALADLALIPVLSTEGETNWASLSDSFIWNHATQFVDPSRLCSVGCHIAGSWLGPDRIERLNEFHTHVLDSSMRPTWETTADWVEQVAKTIRPTDADAWNVFYADIADLFSSKDRWTELHGRELLLDDAGRLRAAGPWPDDSTSPTVFLPPRLSAELEQEADDEIVTSEDELKVPKQLRKAVCYLHPTVELRLREGSVTRRSPTADFLLDSHLVERFNRPAILRHLRRLLGRSKGEATRRQALTWVFGQWLAARGDSLAVDRVGLFVPTRGGWLPADQAIMSREWSGSGGLLEDLLASSSSTPSESLETISDRLLLAPQEWPAKVGAKKQEWAAFLRQLGVQDGLHPVVVSGPKIDQHGHDYNPRQVSMRFALPDEVANPWTEDVSATWGGYSALAHPYTPYRSQATIHVLPGQDAHAHFDDEAKSLFAQLVLVSISDWDPSVFQFTFRRYKPNHLAKPDEQVWPSPVATFLRCAAWVPMADPGQRFDEYFIPVGEAWHYGDDAADPAPRFAPLVPVRYRRLIDRTSDTLNRLQRHGLRVWSDARTAPDRLYECAGLLDSGQIRDSDSGSLRRAYERAWSEVSKAEEMVRQAAAAAPVIVSLGHSLETRVPTEVADDALYVADTAGLVQHVIEAAELPIVQCDPRDGATVASILSEHSSFEVRRTSNTTVEVVVDGQPLVPSPIRGQSFVEVTGEWFVQFIALALQLHPDRRLRVTERVLHEATARLRRIRLVWARNVEIVVAGQRVSDHGGGDRTSHLDDEEAPVLVVAAEQHGSMSWEVLERCVANICELIHRPELTSQLRAASLSLAAGPGAEWRMPTVDEYARALDAPTAKVREALRGLQAETAALQRMLVPIVFCLRGQEAATRFEAAEPQDNERLLDELTRVLGREEAEELIGLAQGSMTLDVLRRAARIDLASINQALRELGRPPIHFEREHGALLNAFVEEHRIQILIALREAYSEAFESGEDLSEYVEARTLRGIEPDPAWLDVYEEPPHEHLRQIVEGWLNGHGASLPPEAIGPTVDETRAANLSLLDTIGPIVVRTVAAWRRSNAKDDRTVVTQQTMSEALNGKGLLDFRMLGEADIPDLLAQVNLWPAAMPRSLDMNELGLTKEDFKKGEDEISRRRAERERQRRVIEFDGQELNAEPEHYGLLAEAVRASLGDLVKSAKSVAKLEALADDGGGGLGPGGRGGGSSTRRDQLSETQKSAIGFVGEVVAYDWLRANYTEATPDSWVSSYRTAVVGGHEGDDSLGYDFRVRQRSQELQFEVKATAGDGCEFSFGESELRAAKRARVGEYRIIFIRHALAPAQRELVVLPNPLETASENLFRQVNEGVRMRFHLADGG